MDRVISYKNKLANQPSDASQVKSKFIFTWEYFNLYSDGYVLLSTKDEHWTQATTNMMISISEFKRNGQWTVDGEAEQKHRIIFSESETNNFMGHLRYGTDNGRILFMSSFSFWVRILYYYAITLTHFIKNLESHGFDFSKKWEHSWVSRMEQSWVASETKPSSRFTEFRFLFLELMPKQKNYSVSADIRY